MERTHSQTPLHDQSTERVRSKYLLIFLTIFGTLAILYADIKGNVGFEIFIKYGERFIDAVIIAIIVFFVYLSIKSIIDKQISPIKYIIIKLFQIKKYSYIVKFAYYGSLYAIFMSAFIALKMEIPRLIPFYLDEYLIEIDKVIFFGADPWRVLHPLFAQPWITRSLDFLYTIWGALSLMVWALVGASTKLKGHTRSQYLWSIFVTWTFIGLVCAAFLSSAGPCFLQYLGSPGAAAYDDLNAYLAEVNQSLFLSSAYAKDLLWGVYSGALIAPGGISAMPSIHNAQAVLFVLIAFRFDRRLGYAALLYAALIFIGSIHLAWHYAIDGIIGGLLAVAVWYCVGAVLAYRQGSATRFNEASPVGQGEVTA